MDKESTNTVNRPKGSLIIISGFSGSGKGTLMKRLVTKYEGYALSISATTRKPREGEMGGREYFFLTEDEFTRLIVEDKLLEYAKYVDNYYGTPKDYVFDKLKEGKDVILEIEMEGALRVKAKYPDTVLIFITPPDIATLEGRLIGRGTETKEEITKRIAKAAMESEGIEAYDYIVVNDDLEETVDRLNTLIASTHLRVNANSELIGKLRGELRTYYISKTKD